MNAYKIYVYTNNYKVLINEFDNKKENIDNPASIYDENLSEQENDQYELTFSLAKFIYYKNDSNIIKKIKNYFFDLLQIGSKISIEFDDNKIILLTIKSIGPNVYSDNIIYNYTAQDIVSYNWSKYNIGYSYSTSETGVQNIFTIARKVLVENDLYPEWDVSIPSSNDLLEKMTLEIEDSNPYNVIIEACNTIGYSLKVNYNTKTISFYNKKNKKFSGYRYYPDINLNNFSVSYNGDNLTSILHVLGGKNEYGEVITMIPSIPTAFKNYITKKYNLFDVENNVINYNNIDWLSPYDSSGSLTIKELIEQGLNNKTGWYSQLNSDLQRENFLTTNKYKIKYFDKENPGIELDSLYYYDSDNNMQKYNGDQYIIKYAIYDDNGEEVYEENVEDSKKIISEEREQELQDLNDFCTIADRNPHLGQYFIDFSFFLKNKMMTNTQYSDITNFYYNELRKYNIIQKIVLPNIYEAKYQISSLESQAKTYAEMYYSDILNYIEACTEEGADLTTISHKYQEQLSNDENLIRTIFIQNNYEYFRYLYSIYTKDEIIEHFKNIYISEKEIYIEKMKKLQNKLQELQNQYDSSSSGSETWAKTFLQSEIDGIKNQLETIKTLTGWTGLDSNGNVIEYESLYDKLYNISIDILEELNPEVLKNIINYQYFYDINLEKIDFILSILYKKYNSFIYEAKYENTDELDSVSLYNQGLVYFEEQKYPTAEYNISVLDLSRLKLIDIPNLEIGSLIKVYNPFLNLSDGEWDPNTQSIKEDSDLCDIQFKNNDLIVTGLTYSLRNSSVIEVSVEQVNNYQKTLEKLLLSVAKK